MGAIDGTHIQIKQLLLNSFNYINRKLCFTLNIQALCDYHCCFIDVVMKWPGSVHDTRMFANSRLNHMPKNKIIPLCCCKIHVLDEEVPVFIIADPVYPLMSYMMKEYAGRGMNSQEQYFGYRLCSARNVIECAFGRLKARFGCLKQAMDINLDDLSNVIYACFVLHNYCELNDEFVNEKSVKSAVCYDREFQPDTTANRYMTDCNETEGKRIRRILTNYYDP